MLSRLFWSGARAKPATALATPTVRTRARENVDLATSVGSCASIIRSWMRVVAAWVQARVVKVSRGLLERYLTACTSAANVAIGARAICIHLEHMLDIEPHAARTSVPCLSVSDVLCPGASQTHAQIWPHNELQHPLPLQQQRKTPLTPYYKTNISCLAINHCISIHDSSFQICLHWHRAQALFASEPCALSLKKVPRQSKLTASLGHWAPVAARTT